MRVGWSSSHGEFLIDDYYYFSKLKKIAEDEGIVAECVDSFYRLENYDVIVFNYPEVQFKLRELSRMRGWLRRRKTVVFASYYNNLDRVSEVINRALKRLNSEIRLEMDMVVDEENNLGDPRFPVAEWNGRKVVMPCSSSVSGGVPVVKSEKAVFASYQELWSGKVIVLGTCVFWDNYSIDLLSNRELALAILADDL
ncbi:hypothetical protein GAH_00178 [Geoglobus ahangari]|uniref:DUF4350 domain-containing protein n=1 Tax=Geoglobus ahangari TaxID=113653 RepID=A0A0F7IGR9_9EURY|nr:DUF4350 domain-containing protein [Geoglobus ahangari]AKG92465.1 hypothetical protein GAH_00178 [Geoglobus ahangari]